MLKSKIFEIRDRATYIPVLAIKMGVNTESNTEEVNTDVHFLMNTGYGLDHPLITVMMLNGLRT